MKTQKLIRNCLSVTLACCVCGLYLVLYAFHLFNQIDQIYIPQRHIRWVVEETPTLVGLSVVPRIAEDTYAEEIEEVEEEKPIAYYIGVPLTAQRGVCKGPSGKETWYNLPMDKVVNKMRSLGYTESDYPYYIRSDGVKTLGDYVIVAADLDEHKRGDIIETSLGLGIVCDTGEFADTTDIDIDIATNW